MGRKGSSRARSVVEIAVETVVAEPTTFRCLVRILERVLLTALPPQTKDAPSFAAFSHGSAPGVGQGYYVLALESPIPCGRLLQSPSCRRSVSSSSTGIGDEIKRKRAARLVD